MSKERKSLSLIFNQELQVGDPEVYNQIISTLSSIGIADEEDLIRTPQDEVSEMIRNIYQKDPDCYSSMSLFAHLFFFFREYSAKILRDIELFRRGERVTFRMRPRPR